jgi:hypothetical protein
LSHVDSDFFASSMALLDGLAPPPSEVDLAGKTRLPIMMVTGLMGTALEGKYTGRKGNLLCPSDEPWHRVWPPAPNEQKPWNIACLFNNLRQTRDPATGTYTEYMPGVEIKADLSPEKSLMAWKGWADQLEALGWKFGEDISALSYDWRPGPDAWLVPRTGEFAVAKAQFEELHARTGRKAVVVSISYGGPFFALFCRHMEPEWLREHISSFVSLSGVYEGSPLAALSMFDGSNILQGVASKAATTMIKLFASKSAKAMLRTLGSLSWLLPSDEMNPHKPLVGTPTANYTTGNLSAALRKAGASEAATMRDAFAPLSGSALAPRVETYCVTGGGLPTLGYIGFRRDDFGGTTPEAAVEMSDGDGTVPASSLRACERWANVQAEPVHQIRYKGDHTAPLMDPLVFDLVLRAATRSSDELII